MNTSLTRVFYSTSLALLVLPFLVFVLSWFHPGFSVPFVLACGWSLVRWFRKVELPEIPFVENRRAIFLALGLIFCWVFASGIGGFAFQNIDHYYRNAVLYNLTLNSWPVVFPGSTPSEPSYTLIYYFGFFLLPALGGKVALLLGASDVVAINIAFLFSFIQAFIEVFATFVLISWWLGRFTLWPLFFFIGFSGLDIVPYLFYTSWDPPEITTFFGKCSAFLGVHAPHLEWYTYPWMNSSITGLLFWVFNQSVPFLLALMIFQTLRDWRGILLVYAALFLSAPFPALGLFPVMVWRLLKDAEFRLIPLMKIVCTPANLLSIPVVLLIAHFYSGNISSGHFQFIYPVSAHEWGLLAVYFVTEWGIWLLCIGRKWSVELGICMVVVCVTSFFQLGSGADFAMRTAIPCFIFLMLALLRTWYASETPGWRRVLILCVFLIGCMNPLMEFKRCAGNTLLTYIGLLRGSETVAFSVGPECTDENMPHYYIRDERLHSVYDLLDRDDPWKGNFLGKRE